MASYTHLDTALSVQGLARTIRSVGNKLLIEAGCPLEHSQLTTLYGVSRIEYDSESSIRDMCRLLNVEPSTFFRSTVKLEKAGLIIKKLVSYSDKKRTMMLTPAGQEMLDVYTPILHKTAETVFGEAYKSVGAAIKKIGKD